MRLAVSSPRPHDAAPMGLWRRIAACLAVAALLAHGALSAHAFMAMAGGADEMCSVKPDAVPAGDGHGSAGGQPAAETVHCPVCTAAPGGFAPPPPAMALAAPLPLRMAGAVPAVSFDVVQPPYLDGPPGHAPPTFA